MRKTRAQNGGMMEIDCYSREYEEQHLKECVNVIEQNIEKYATQEAILAGDIKEMYDHYHDDSPEIYTELSNTMTMHGSIKRALNKNRKALQKPYFGRIDYLDHEDNKKSSLYLGKHGVMKSSTEIEVVDWRAPISSVYYESEVGECNYRVPEGEYRDITLNLKRTYEVEKDKLFDFYDSEVVANDELLTKYLAKNKEAVLGEIIATIQKEQNDIIRQSPFHNVVVQGVAGSGKTTVAMHRISYILYNYQEKFRPKEFFIIGSNRILLDYITSVLPDLDVYGINQMTLEQFCLHLLEEEIINDKYKIISHNQNNKKEYRKFAERKGSLSFLKELDAYLCQREIEMIPRKTVVYGDEVLFSEEAFDDFMKNNKRWSTHAKITMLNERALNKIKNYFTGRDYEYEKEERKAAIKQFNNYYGPKKWKYSIITLYQEFLQSMLSITEGEEQLGIQDCILSISKKEVDVYDLAALLYIKRRMVLTEELEDAKHVVVDEAQDYGSMVFGVLRYVLPRCTFTVMGDVSQNINYDSGMNDWEALKQEVFNKERDTFGVLAKSYRNTIEISNYATSILSHCTFPTYQVEPIIRHGATVAKHQVSKESELVSSAVNIIKTWQENGYDTIAVICKDSESTEKVSRLLGKHRKVMEGSLENAVFSKGVMVLPIQLTKGLEFDTVLLWNPDQNSYEKNDANAKLLYVAATRALHELTMVYQNKLSELL